MLMRLIDYLKTCEVTAMFTSLTEGGSPVEQSSVGVSSLIDTWLLVRDIEMSGERNRGLYVLKSRGMAHSNQIREFVLTDQGVRLLDVYSGSAGVLTGTARMVQEEKDKVVTLTHRNNIERKHRELQRMKEALDTQIASMRAKFAAESLKLETSIEDYRAIERSLAEQRKVLADRREGHTINGSSNSRKGTKDGCEYQTGTDSRGNGRKERARVPK